MNYTSQFYCPFCKNALEVTHRDRYQDLSEHVSDPNGKPSLKDGYECLNEKCLASGTHTWIEDGDYFSSRPENVEYSDWKRLREEKAGGKNFYAIGTWNYYYQVGKDVIKKKSFKIDIRWYKFNFFPREYGWEYPIEKRHMPNMLRWKLEIWKKNSNYGHVHVIPFWKMANHCIREFKSAHMHWKASGNLKSLKDAYRQTASLDLFNHVDDRFYKKVTAIYLWCFHYRKCKEVNLSFKINNTWK
jgi:hypothetical protein